MRDALGAEIPEYGAFSPPLQWPPTPLTMAPAPIYPVASVPVAYPSWPPVNSREAVRAFTSTNHARLLVQGKSDAKQAITKPSNQRRPVRLPLSRVLKCLEQPGKGTNLDHSAYNFYGADLCQCPGVMPKLLQDWDIKHAGAHIANEDADEDTVEDMDEDMDEDWTQADSWSSMNTDKSAMLARTKFEAAELVKGAETAEANSLSDSQVYVTVPDRTRFASSLPTWTLSKIPVVAEAVIAQEDLEGTTLSHQRCMSAPIAVAHRTLGIPDPLNAVRSGHATSSSENSSSWVDFDSSTGAAVDKRTTGQPPTAYTIKHGNPFSRETYATSKMSVDLSLGVKISIKARSSSSTSLLTAALATEECEAEREEREWLKAKAEWTQKTQARLDKLDIPSSGFESDSDDEDDEVKVSHTEAEPPASQRSINLTTDGAHHETNSVVSGSGMSVQRSFATLARVSAKSLKTDKAAQVETDDSHIAGHSNTAPMASESVSDFYSLPNDDSLYAPSPRPSRRRTSSPIKSGLAVASPVAATLPVIESDVDFNCVLQSDSIQTASQYLFEDTTTTCYPVDTSNRDATSDNIRSMELRAGALSAPATASDWNSVGSRKSSLTQVSTTSLSHTHRRRQPARLDLVFDPAHLYRPRDTAHCVVSPTIAETPTISNDQGTMLNSIKQPNVLIDARYAGGKSALDLIFAPSKLFHISSPSPLNTNVA